MKKAKVIFAVIFASPLEIFHREEEEEEQAAVKKNAGNSTIRGNIGCLLLTRAIALAKHTARNAGKRVAGWGKKRKKAGGEREGERGGREISRRKTNARIFHLELDHWKNVI